jgi:hypothetical protein
MPDMDELDLTRSLLMAGNELPIAVLMVEDEADGLTILQDSTAREHSEIWCLSERLGHSESGG